MAPFSSVSFSNIFREVSNETRGYVDRVIFGPNATTLSVQRQQQAEGRVQNPSIKQSSTSMRNFCPATILGGTMPGEVKAKRRRIVPPKMVAGQKFLADMLLCFMEGFCARPSTDCYRCTDSVVALGPKITLSTYPLSLSITLRKISWS